MAHRESANKAGGWKLELSSTGGGNGTSGLRGDQGVCFEEAEYVCTIYCDATNSGPL